MKFPNTISLNTYRAYIDPNEQKCKSFHSESVLNAIQLNWEEVGNYVETLRVLCIKTIAENWQYQPIFSEITDVENRNYLLDIIDVNIAIKELAAHINYDVFWKRCFQQKWKHYFPQTITKPWINIFMEKYLADTLENMKPSDYEEEKMQQLLEICSPHLQYLHVTQLQPAMDDKNDHIPLDFILSCLTELRAIDITFDLKNIGTNFFLGCSNISKNDIKSLSLGLEKCYELLKFRLHSSKLEPYMLKMLARALEKGCGNLESISFQHCKCGDMGLVAFLDSLSRESFPQLKHIILTNNFVSFDGTMELVEVIKRRNIESLDLRLNPIMSDGAAAVLGICNDIPIERLNLSCCSIDDTIDVILLDTIRNNKTLKLLNLSANKLGIDLGRKVAKAVVLSKQLQELDVRNTGINATEKRKIDSVILDNRDEL